jgi:hypothetical protein
MGDSAGKSHFVDQLFRPLPMLRCRAAIGKVGKEDILEHGELRQQVMVLKHKTNLVATEGAERRIVELEGIDPVERDTARGGTVERPENGEQGTLARATGTENCKTLSPLEGERQLREHNQWFGRSGILLRQVVDRQCAHGVLL